MPFCSRGGVKCQSPVQKTPKKRTNVPSNGNQGFRRKSQDSDRRSQASLKIHGKSSMTPICRNFQKSTARNPTWPANGRKIEFTYCGKQVIFPKTPSRRPEVSLANHHIAMKSSFSFGKIAKNSSLWIARGPHHHSFCIARGGRGAPPPSNRLE